MECSNYDYNGVIFVFGRIDKSVTDNWADVTKVKMSVDSVSDFVYSADIKEIPYTQTTNFDGSECVNNTKCKVFNINTFTHRRDEDVNYQFGGGEHTCYLRFYYTNRSYVQAEVAVEVHATLETPTVYIDEKNGIVNVSRSTTSGSLRYYIEIRRKDRNKINPNIFWEDKDYIHTVVLKGIEGGKYNEGIPHTGFMVRGESDIAGSGSYVETVKKKDVNKVQLYSSDETVSISAKTKTAEIVGCDVDIPYISDERTKYYEFTAPETAVYYFTQEYGPDLECTLYADGDYSAELAYNDDMDDENTSFGLMYSINKGQTIYIKIFDYSINGQSLNLRINTVETQSVTSFTPYSIAAYATVQISFHSASGGYVTLYPAKKAAGLVINEAITKGGKTPYYVLPVSSGTNKYSIYNRSNEMITYQITDLHSDIDYQPYWRVNPISSFNACVIFDDAEIEKKYSGYCISQVKDALTRLSNIISETSGKSITFNVINKGVCKLYVKETKNSFNKDGIYVNGNKIASDNSKIIYYASVKGGSVYRVNYGHDTLYCSESVATETYVGEISDNSEYMRYEKIGGDCGADENTLVIENETSGYYVVSNSYFTLEKVVGVSESSQLYHDEFADEYNIVIRFGLDGTTWMGNQGIATSSDINGQGKWINWLYHDSRYGIAWSYAIINVDNADLFETLFHVIHEEIAQSLGIGDDCYSREESIHWDPEYSNPDWYTGIDRTILDFVYENDKNGYTQFDLCNEYDLPITLFREYSNYNSETKTYQFRLKDAAGNWLLRSGEYEVYAWCAGIGSNNGDIAGSGNNGWDDDPYSLRSAAVKFTVQGGWYWLDYGIDMKNGSKKLKISDVRYDIWNSFVDAVADVMGAGTIPDDSINYGSAAKLSFEYGIKKAKLTEYDKVLYAQRFNIVNYIVNSKVATGIGIQKSLTSQVLAEHMEKLQDCRNLM